ncbi:MAG: hypothetical protein RSC80_01055 [Odoribacter sp.]
MKWILFLLCGSLFSFSFCAEETKGQEVRTGVYPDGSIRYKGHFLDGKPVGEWFRYYPDGRIKAKMNHRGDTVEAILYSLKGDYSSSGKYVKQKKEGRWEYRNATCLLVREEYRQNLLEGTSVRYFSSGKEAEKKEWSAGKPEGEWCLYYDNGNLRMRASFKAGKLEGAIKSYRIEGEMSAEGAYKNDLKEGRWIFYDEQGKPFKERVYYSGIPENVEEVEWEESRKLDALLDDGKKIPDPAQFMDDPEMYMRLTGDRFLK